jgi:hypothetical protein
LRRLGVEGIVSKRLGLPYRPGRSRESERDFLIDADAFPDWEYVPWVRASHLRLDHAAASPGRRTVNTEPLPGSLVTVTSPPIKRASLRVMASPSPVPPKRCAVVASAWVRLRLRVA